MKQPCMSINARAGTTGGAGGNATASVNNHPGSRLGARNDGPTTNNASPPPAPPRHSGESRNPGSPK